MQSAQAQRRRRQIGADRRTAPIPAYPEPPSDRALTFSRLAMLVTVGGWVSYVTTTIIRQFVNEGTQSMRFTSEAVSYLLVVTLLTASALAPGGHRPQDRLQTDPEGGQPNHR